MNRKIFSYALLAALLLCGTALFAQSGSDFRFNLNDDFTAITITGYTGSATVVNIPAEIDGIPVREIWYQAFYSNSRITQVTIPENVTNIAYEAFRRCTNLTAVSFPSSLTSIGEVAFRGCTKLTTVRLPSGLTSINSETFAECTNLTTLSLPSGLASIDEVAFYGCTKLTTVSLPGSLMSISSGAFADCGSLVSIILEEGARIDFEHQNAFQGCKPDVRSQMALKRAGYTGTF
jgi:hypothetical protein